MNTHFLKTDPEVFKMSFCGTKTYEIRLDDRGFKVGDVLMLEETLYSGSYMKENGLAPEFTGRQLMRRIDYILGGYGLKPGWVILSVSKF
jgi:hypothetical protein